jgi:hypothetical protein
MNKLPDFIVIGAGKCGTTSLFSYLQNHPQIYLCPKKETYFFLSEPNRSKLKPWGAITDFNEYRSLFENAPENTIVGEISTTYYAHLASAQQIQAILPDVKIIAILRDPADRAFSDYQMHFNLGNEKADFADLIIPENRYIKSGFYYRELMPFYQTFPVDHIKILFFDDLCRDPIAFMQDLCRFVGADPEFVSQIDTSKKAREGGLPKNNRLHQLLSQKNPLRSIASSVLKLFVPLEARQKIRSNLIKNNTYKAKLSEAERKKAIKIYREDIIQLQGLIGKDLSSWLD